MSRSEFSERRCSKFTILFFCSILSLVCVCPSFHRSRSLFFNEWAKKIERDLLDVVVTACCLAFNYVLYFFSRTIKKSLNQHISHAKANVTMCGFQFNIHCIVIFWYLFKWFGIFISVSDWDVLHKIIMNSVFCLINRMSIDFIWNGLFRIENKDEKFSLCRKEETIAK